MYADCCSLQTRAPASGKTQHRCARPNVPSSSRVITLSISISLSVGAKMKTAPVDVQINQENWLVLMRTKKKKRSVCRYFVASEMQTRGQRTVHGRLRHVLTGTTAGCFTGPAETLVQVVTFFATRPLQSSIHTVRT